MEYGFAGNGQARLQQESALSPRPLSRAFAAPLALFEERETARLRSNRAGSTTLEGERPLSCFLSEARFLPKTGFHLSASCFTASQESYCTNTGNRCRNERTIRAEQSRHATVRTITKSVA
jgi:hypothetical protein